MGPYSLPMIGKSSATRSSIRRFVPNELARNEHVVLLLSPKQGWLFAVGLVGPLAEAAAETENTMTALIFKHLRP